MPTENTFEMTLEDDGVLTLVSREEGSVVSLYLSLRHRGAANMTKLRLNDTELIRLYDACRRELELRGVIARRRRED